MSAIDVRSKILEQAVRLFSRNGYGSTSVQKLAEAAGITKPTVYYHFGSKEGLFEALVQHHLNGFEALVGETVLGSGRALHRLQAFAEQYLMGALEESDSVRFMLNCTLPASADSEIPHCHVFRRVLQIMTPLEDVIRQGMKAGEFRTDLDPRAAVLALMGTLNLHLAMALEDPAPGPATVDPILNLWLHGVAA